MIVDYKNIEAMENVLTVVEQIPGLIVAEDQTRQLLNASYWASYNRAFYEDVYEQTGVPEMVKKHGRWFSHDRTPRALISKREQTKVKRKNVRKIFS